MKKIIIFLGIILTSCQSERLVVKVTVKTTLTQDINQSIVDGFYNNDTTGLTSKIYLVK
jgi:hypothetical protein